MIVDENKLDSWVDGNAEVAQGVIPELVYRLVSASSPRPRFRRFPLADSIGQHGSDGQLDAVTAFGQFVPDGKSRWEFGTDGAPARKATADYRASSLRVRAVERRNSCFIFVTPRSGRRCWKADSQNSWVAKRKQEKKWRDVRVIDATRLIDWLHSFPAVELWLAEKMGLRVDQIESVRTHWSVISTFGSPPPLVPEVFLAARSDAVSKVRELLTGQTTQLVLETRHPGQLVDFVSAVVSSLPDGERIDAEGRTLIVAGAEGWRSLSIRNAGERLERHVLIADPRLDLSDSSGLKLLQEASLAGHSVIFAKVPGGNPHPNSERLRQARPDEVSEALRTAGHSPERARQLGQRCGGNLQLLLRMLQGAALTPGWASGGAAADLAVAAFLGAWDEDSEGDREVVEEISGKEFGEWIDSLRGVASQPETPLVKHQTRWKFLHRFEGWAVLSPRLSEEKLRRFQRAAERVLSEVHPKFELDPEDRFAAQVYGKVPKYSEVLRLGIAEGAALLASHPAGLTTASGRAEDVATLIVRKVLSSTDWRRWATIEHALPFLAEAAPGEFLDQVDRALERRNSPLDNLMVDEPGGVMGRTYLSGLLWALETLAWAPDYLVRVIHTLGALDERDKGGQWANRPANSLATILLPWLPQTTASIEKRALAVRSLIEEKPTTGWKLLLRLLPSNSQMSHGTRKPVWRDFIPESWSETLTRQQYLDQVRAYGAIAVEVARRDMKLATELAERLPDLTEEVRNQFLDFVTNDVAKRSENDRSELWEKLTSLIRQHRRFRTSDWAMRAGVLKRVERAAKAIEPRRAELRHAPLFTEQMYDMDIKGSAEARRNSIEVKRDGAVKELARGGIERVLSFAASVDSPWRVGDSLGRVGSQRFDKELLPKLLGAKGSAGRVVNAFVWARFHAKKRWKWVETLGVERWRTQHIANFYSLLPFIPEAWQRAEAGLKARKSLYWQSCNPHPYHNEGKGLGPAIDRLVEFGRPLDAVRCIYVQIVYSERFDSAQTVRVLSALAASESGGGRVEEYELREVIEKLQSAPDAVAADVARIEWAFLPVFHRDGMPKFLERELARSPEFFCQVVELVFRSRKKAKAGQRSKKPTKAQEGMARNGYQLLTEWSTVPGKLGDAEFSGEQLSQWISEVKRRTRASGHFEAAMTMVGQVLSRAPRDASGLWLHAAVAKELNREDSKHMRDGFRMALHNRRGVFGFSGGKDESEIAKDYRSKAESIEAAGFHRVAVSLRQLAESYERLAQRHAAQSEVDEQD